MAETDEGAPVAAPPLVTTNGVIRPNAAENVSMTQAAMQMWRLLNRPPLSK